VWYGVAMFPHEEHEPDWPMDNVVCQIKDCYNYSMHDWGATILCCAHDEIYNMMMRIEQLEEFAGIAQR
jgi:hypothetical protein